MADISDLNNSSTQFGVGQTTGVTGPIPTPKTGTNEVQDTISASEAVASTVYIAGIPVLIPPSEDFNVANILNGIGATQDSGLAVLKFQNAIDQICLDMLDNWSRNLKEEAEKIKRKLESPDYIAQQQQHSSQFIAHQQEQTAIRMGADVQSYVNSLAPPDPSQVSQLIQQYSVRVDISQGVDSYLQDTKAGKTGALGVLPIVTAATLIGSVSVLANFPNVTASVEGGFMTGTFDNFVNMIPNDMRAELGLLGSMFAMGTLNYAEASNVADAASGKKTHSKQSLAENYASKVIQLAESNVLNGFIQSLFAKKTENGVPLSQEKMNELTAKLTIMLLSTCLGALYTAGTGWIDGEDFKGLLKSKGDDKSLESKIISLLNNELEKLSPFEREKMVGALAKYMSKHPSFKSFFDIEKSVEGMLSAGSNVTDVGYAKG